MYGNTSGNHNLMIGATDTIVCERRGPKKGNQSEGELLQGGAGIMIQRSRNGRHRSHTTVFLTHRHNRDPSRPLPSFSKKQHTHTHTHTHTHNRRQPIAKIFKG